VKTDPSPSKAVFHFNAAFAQISGLTIEVSNQKAALFQNKHIFNLRVFDSPLLIPS
jgi:hypothetical protein